MCGIAGYIPAEGLGTERSLVASMCDRLVHRGPDAYGVFCDDFVALGHRRLSIIDIAGGDQPLANEDGSLQIVFNGEIYNFLELRRELQEKGHQFSTRSDTEVLVHLYEEVGQRLPEFLNGMFAFAIWDSRNRELFLARDRVGKKPLYYSATVPGMRFCFASELKAFAALPGFSPGIDYRSVADFLSLSYIPDPNTIYEDVSKLRPGHSLTVTNSGIRHRKYWEPVFEEDGALGRSEIVEEIHSLVADAVKRRMISDVPLGAFLSGGVDSSAVVGLMAANAPGRVKTFSIGFSDKHFDELRFARMVVEQNQTEHTEQVVTPSIHDVLEPLSNHFDEPFGDSSAIPMLYLAKMTREYVTVALCGDGADELFGGYRRYYFGVLEERIRSKFPDSFRSSVFRFGGKHYPHFAYLPQVFRAKTLLTNLSQELGDSYYTTMSTFRDGDLHAVLSPESRKIASGHCVRDNFRKLFGSASHLSPLAQMQHVDYMTWLPGDILVKADRATMAYSLESRSPWLDYRLVELAGRLPSSVKLKRNIGKYVFKQAIADYVPPAILNRTKMGFSVPLASWFRTSLKPTFESVVFRADMQRYICLDEARRLWVEHQSRLRNHDQKLWNLLVFALWDLKFNNSSRSDVLAPAMIGAA